MRVVEVFPGTAASPKAQYVTLQMLSDGQNLVKGHTLTIYGATGNIVGAFTFTGDAANASKGDTLWIATAEAKTFFSLDPDLTMTAVIPMAGGAACFEVWDCAGWGSYSTLTAPPSSVGTPFRKADGLVSGQAMKRKPDTDTGNSASDFELGTPAPKNNARQSGTIPASTCPNASIEGLEECDDGGSDPGDGCSAKCTLEPKVIPDAGPPDAVNVPDAGKPKVDASPPDAAKPAPDAGAPDAAAPDAAAADAVAPDAAAVVDAAAADATPSDAAPTGIDAHRILPEDISACACHVGQAHPTRPWPAALGLLALALWLRRRRRPH
jgi:MYXO-CTERM domain-containing protein